MRTQLEQDASADRFAKQLLNLGNGKIAVDDTTQCITDPNDFCKLTQDVEELMNWAFPNMEHNYRNQKWLCERALLAPTNVDVYSINSSILTRVPGNVIAYKSNDTVTTEDDAVNYPIEFLN